MNIKVKYNNLVDKIFVQTPINTEVLAFNEYTGEEDWYLQSDCILSRNGSTWLVKEPYLQ